MIQNGLLCQGFNTSHVTLYRYQISLRTSGRQVSIHLMLLFICMPPPEMYRKRSFNTSHVTLYPGWLYRQYRRQFVSIHLMLLFIWYDYLQINNTWTVSIHLMLLFIVMMQYVTYGLARFNTSHVTLYPAVSIEVIFSYLFQYISCYSLSIISKRRTLWQTSFNTSHVTLYRSCLLCRVQIF